MKKLTLTLFAIAASVALCFAGPERFSGKDKEVIQPAPPPCEWYRAHEWDLDIWGAFAFSANPGRFDVANTDPFFPDTDPFEFDIGTGVFTEPSSQNPDERVNIGRVTKDQLFARDNTWGGGVDMKYFWSRYFGAGIEGFAFSAENVVGGGLVTLTARYPIGRFAPYGWGGIGVIAGGNTLYRFFNEKPDVSNEQEFWTDSVVENKKVRGLGQLGIGLEYRVTCHIGLMADVSWNFVFGNGSGDKFQTITETGQDLITFFGTQIAIVPDNNTAQNLRPGAGSDNQDFGMARCGVTFSY